MSRLGTVVGLGLGAIWLGSCARGDERSIREDPGGVRDPVMTSAGSGGMAGGQASAPVSAGAAGSSAGSAGNSGLAGGAGMGSGGESGSPAQAGNGGAAEAGNGGAPSTFGARDHVLDYLKSISGTKTIAGQHNREPNAMPRQWTDAVHETVGQFPGLWSGDFLFQADDIASRGVMIDEAIAQFRQGALVSLLWHACSPAQSEPCAWDGGVLGALTDPQWTELTTDGTALNSAWKSRLDTVAVHLQTLEDAGVAVLFRPLHEMNQSAFWWGGRSGPSGTRRLYQLTHDYLVETKGLTNLIWVWDVLDQSLTFADYDPGAEYWDVAALDVNGAGFTSEKYQAMLAVAGDKPIAVGHCTRLPTPAELAAQPRWLFFMAWAELVYQENNEAEITATYGASSVLTLNELPGW